MKQRKNALWEMQKLIDCLQSTKWLNVCCYLETDVTSFSINHVMVGPNLTLILDVCLLQVRYRYFDIRYRTAVYWKRNSCFSAFPTYFDKQK
ncbi:hypothetical protein L596_013647 [Steinernema carpocapsae]|uniref:Uncharacterized protein n=1 Tax=Steinernema carpocapsae TaxID=34508 RepID=A0A4U5P1N6_STECR|nr:hypothetical protein L596_013647 [Steinernema carpocapsae]